MLTIEGNMKLQKDKTNQRSKSSWLHPSIAYLIIKKTHSLRPMRLTDQSFAQNKSSLPTAGFNVQGFA